MESPTELVFWFMILLFVVLPVTLLVNGLLRSLLSYRFTDKNLLIVVFGMVPIFRISYQHITNIKSRADWPESLRDFFPPNFCNKLYPRQGVTLIRRRRGLSVVICPDDPDGFVRELRQRVHQRTGEWPPAS